MAQKTSGKLCEQVHGEALWDLEVKGQKLAYSKNLIIRQLDPIRKESQNR